MANICRRCVISGTVQGVFYRQSAKEQALAYNLTGWVKNLSNGQVEALICGEEEGVMDMLRWLQVGPPRAKVSNVSIETANYEEHTSFTIK